MNLKEHFGSQHGIGILSTADAQGRVDAAIYSRPHVFEDGTVAFVMRERLTHHNVSQNAYAGYLFIEKGSGLGGVRLILKLPKEETDHDPIASMIRRHPSPAEDGAKRPKFLDTFAVEKALPLIGAGQTQGGERPDCRRSQAGATPRGWRAGSATCAPTRRCRRCSKRVGSATATSP